MKARVASVTLDSQAMDITTNSSAASFAVSSASRSLDDNINAYQSLTNQNIHSLEDAGSSAVSMLQRADAETIVKLDQNLTQYNGGGRVFYNHRPEDNDEAAVEGDVIWTFQDYANYSDAKAYKYTYLNNQDTGLTLQTIGNYVAKQPYVNHGSGNMGWIEVPAQRDIFAGQMHGGKVTGAEIEGATFHGITRQYPDKPVGVLNPYVFRIGVEGDIHGASFDTLNFQVDKRGNVTATSIDVEGGTISIGGQGKNAPFYVDSNGAVTASNLDIEGGSISIGGQGNNANFYVDSSGAVTAHDLNVVGGSINLGKDDGSTAFSVDNNGSVFAYSITARISSEGIRGDGWHKRLYNDGQFQLLRGVMTMASDINDTNGADGWSQYTGRTHIEPNMIKLRADGVSRTDVRAGRIEVDVNRFDNNAGTIITPSNIIADKFTSRTTVEAKGNIITNKEIQAASADITNKITAGTLTTVGAMYTQGGNEVASRDWVTGYAQKYYVSNEKLNQAISNIRIPSAPSVDLSSYATKNYVTNAINNQSWTERNWVVQYVAKNSNLSIKHDIQELDSKRALAELNATEVVSYKYNQDIERNRIYGNKTFISPIIDDVNQTPEYYVPQSIVNRNDGNGNDTLQMDNYVGYLHLAIQELSKQIREQSLKISQLERNNTNG